jgi:hypothetical protein
MVPKLLRLNYPQACQMGGHAITTHDTKIVREGLIQSLTGTLPESFFEEMEIADCLNEYFLSVQS